MAVDRRRFIKNMAGAVSAFALPTFVPASVFGQNSAPGANDRINIGFVGMGGRVLGHKGNNYAGLLKFFLNEEACVVRAVCDINLKHLKLAEDRVNQFYQNSDCLTFTDFRDILARPDIDAIVIGTSHNWHGTMTILACEAGKDVYVEKPTANTIIEGKKMAEAVKRHGRVMQAGLQARSSTRFKYMADLIQQGVIGHIKTIQIGVDKPPVFCDLPAQPVPEHIVDWDMWVGPSPWRPYNQYLYDTCWKYIGFGGGIITDWGQHFFDVSQWALGMDESGPTEIHPPGNDYEYLTFKYANGTEMFIHMKNGKRLSGGTLFFGEKGEIDTVAWNDQISFKPEYLAHQYFDQTYKGNNVDPRQLGNHVANFLDCVRTRKKTNANEDTSYRSITVALLANIGLHLKRPLKWDPANVRFVGDVDANRYLDTMHRSPWVI